MSFSEFLSMGGYGAYVWTSYGIAAVVLIENLPHSCSIGSLITLARGLSHGKVLVGAPKAS